jgi:polysaccharide biosynthesis protein PslH
MRILAIKSEYPSPPRVGSAILAYNHLLELSRRHAVTLVCHGRREQRDSFADYLVSVEWVEPPVTTRIARRGSYIVAALLGMPANVRAYRSPAMESRVVELLQKNDFDVILIYELGAVQYCPASELKRSVVHAEDPQSTKLRRLAALPVLPLSRKAQFFVESFLTRYYETRTLSQAARVLLLSVGDVTDMATETGLKNLAWCPYGVNPPSTAVPGFASRTPGLIVLSGNMFHPPNIDGAFYFLHEIFPLILRAAPAARLSIVGDRPDPRIARVAARFGQSVQVTGPVSLISDYLRKAVVSVCPIRLKIGVQTKILEAMAVGTPVVSTAAGNSGIGGRSGEELWVEDVPARFATRVVELLHQEDWDRLSQGGIELLRRSFSWENSASALEKNLEQALIPRA